MNSANINSFDDGSECKFADRMFNALSLKGIFNENLENQEIPSLQLINSMSSSIEDPKIIAEIEQAFEKAN